ncbi:CLUMA_CG008457, isoform A [Clunio marinus]|uniref:CLUMA_CG008457, isoform A n=1 Tax=Clunio marinus TaxID=568069 RepID=A0A1J1I961_9DIPT|nr:CLUMA_CG008457, isoform A [Clunio marinus]
MIDTKSKSPEKKFISGSLVNKKSKLIKQKKKGNKHRSRGVVYIKHLPHGFYEEQLRGYFSQFGAITRLRLARSPKTLKSKGYAFIEFRYPEVAEIAAGAMNNYMMFKNIIKTAYIAPKDIKYDYFRSGIKRINEDGQKVITSKSIEARKAIVENSNKLMTDADQEKRIKRIAEKLNEHKAKAASLGIDYDIDAIASNMGDKVIEAMEKSKSTTIETLSSDGESDDSDESFNPSNFEFEDDSEDTSDFSDDDSGDESGDDNKNRKVAINVALEASMRANEDQSTNRKKTPRSKSTHKPIGFEDDTIHLDDDSIDDKKSRRNAIKVALEASMKANEDQSVVAPKKIRPKTKRSLDKSLINHSDDESEDDSIGDKKTRRNAIKVALEASMKANEDQSVVAPKKLRSQTKRPLDKSLINHSDDDSEDDSIDDKKARRNAIKVALEASMKANEDQSVVAPKKLRSQMKRPSDKPIREEKQKVDSGTNCDQTITESFVQKEILKNAEKKSSKGTEMSESFFKRSEDDSTNGKKSSKGTEMSESFLNLNDHGVVKNSKKTKLNEKETFKVPASNILKKAKINTETKNTKSPKSKSRPTQSIPCQTEKTQEKASPSPPSKNSSSATSMPLAKSSHTIEKKRNSNPTVKTKEKLKLMAKVSKSSSSGSDKIVNIRVHLGKGN